MTEERRPRRRARRGQGDRHGRQSGTMDFEEYNFRRHTTMAMPTYLPTALYNLIVRAHAVLILLFRASWESLLSRLGRISDVFRPRRDRMIAFFSI